MTLVIPQSDLVTTPLLIGTKARTLALVAAECGHVPTFAGLPTELIERLWRAEDEERITLLAEIVSEVKQLLPDAVQVAVRSAALQEDQENSSLAGQFHTELAIDWEQVPEAIWKVVQIGVMRLKGRAEFFSCFIQEYKEADLAGVTFTRGPEGDPRLFVEYHAGRGEALVSGTIQPETRERFWGEEHAFVLPGLSDGDELLLTWKRLEEYFGHPQDIEWCVVQGVWFVLQSRPITTISSNVYQGLLEADAVLPVKVPFFYEQTEIAELAPHPSQLTLSLLERLYDENGPIARAYASLGITYDPRDFFSIVAGQLYVDREEELQTLLPAFTLLDPKTPGIPQKKSLLAPLQQLKLQRALAAARVPAPIQRGRLLEALQLDLTEITITEWTERFLAVYETVFLTNIATQQALARLDPILARTQISVASLLSSKCAAAYRLDLADVRHVCDSSWQGNGLDVADASPFTLREASEKEYQEVEVDRWWQELTSLSRSAYEPVIRAAVQADQLREVGRWVTVRWIHALRTRILARAQTEGLGVPEAFQIRLEEWEQGLPSDEERRERVDVYTRSLTYRLPTRLTNLAIQEEKVLRGLSAGMTEGTLTLPETLGLMTSATPVILLVEQLRPELAPFLSRVQGIVTARGGMLSHLAILAREEHIPVVSGVLFQELQARLGRRVRIDGSKGHIEILGGD